MLPGPWTLPVPAGHAPDTRFRWRFAAALGLSVLVHCVFSLGIAPDGARAVRADTPVATIEARLAVPAFRLPDPALDAPAAVNPPEAAAPAPRLGRQTRAPPPAVPAETAAPDATRAPSHAADPTYYPARQLDVYPVLATPLDLRYGAKAAAADVTGHVLLLVMIDHDGAVDEANVVEAQPPGVFDEAARRAFLGARFRPASKDGRAVKARVLVHVSYEAESAR